MLGEATEAITRRAALRLAGEGRELLPSLVAERQRLNQEWTSLYEQTYIALESAGSEAEQDRARLAAARRAAEGRLARIDQELRTRFPGYLDLVRPRSISESAARALVGPNEAILMIVPSRFGTHLIAVTDREVHWARSDWTGAQVLRAVRRLRWNAGAPVALPAEELRALQAEGLSPRSFDRRAAHALYRQVVAPLLTALAGKTHLYVAATGSLASLPLSVLVTEAPAGADDDPAALRATSWMGDRFALTHIPSIPALASLRAAASAGGSPGRVPLMAFGDPLLQGQASQRGLTRSGAEPWGSAAAATRSAASGTLVQSGQLLRLARLPGTAVELEAVRALFGASSDALHLGGRATESAVRSADLRSARLLSFATHALVPGEVDGIVESGLVLSPPDQPTSSDDGFLAASEVAALQISADWVVLSACNTATSLDGQGLSDLARAFFHAGARNLLASHWPVSDEVAPRLVVEAVKLHEAGASRAVALQRAMIGVRNDASHDGTSQSWAHPFFWAPFVLIGGDPGPTP
jgi:CHAT domain-containing protein